MNFLDFAYTLLGLSTARTEMKEGLMSLEYKWDLQLILQQSNLEMKA